MGKSADLFKERLRAALDRDPGLKSRICDRLGMSRSNMDAYLKGNSIPGLDRADEIAECLGLTLAELLAQPGPPVPVEHPIEECLRRIGAAIKGTHDPTPGAPDPASDSPAAAIRAALEKGRMGPPEQPAKKKPGKSQA